MRSDDMPHIIAGFLKEHAGSFVTGTQRSVEAIEAQIVQLARAKLDAGTSMSGTGDNPQASVSRQTINVTDIAAALNDGVATEVIPQENFEAYMADVITADAAALGLTITTQLKEDAKVWAKERMELMREDAQALSNYLQKLNKEGGTIDSNSVDSFLSAQRWSLSDSDKKLLTQYALSLMAQETASGQPR